jgi:hypothetical protein
MAFIPGAANVFRGTQVQRPPLCHRSGPRMALGAHVGDDTTPDDYITVGVAKYFRRVEAKLEELLVIEPLPASALDCIARLQVPTSYLRIWASLLGDLPDRIDEMPKGVVLEGEHVQFGEDFTERCQASARTYRRSPEVAELLPVGSIFTKLNHSIETKRLIDEDWEPDFNDNVKQDLSIDVYDRSVDESATGIKTLYNA